VDYAADGDLSGYTDEDIADATLWEGDAGDLVAALTAAGFLDADRHIHDWADYAGRLLEKRRQDAERKRLSRGQRPPSPTVPSPSNGHPRDVQRTARVTGPNRTGPNQTLPDRTGPETRDERAAAADAPTPPEALRAFDQLLQRAPGYEPSPEFYEKVLERYRGVDLSEEALKLVGWLAAPPQRRAKRTANTATILNWLKRAGDPPPRKENTHGPPGESTSDAAGDERFAAFRKYG
jgi:hypothetical protein